MKSNLLKILKKKSHKENLKDNNYLTTFLNPYSYLLARGNPQLFEEFDSICIDGIALVKILKIFGLADVVRKSFDMTSLVPIVFDNAIEENKTIYFIGTKPKVIDQAIENIKLLYPELDIVGYRDGYFNDNRERVLQSIVDIHPDIVVCGMGAPLQEQLLVDLQNIGWSGTGYTCGGFLHQIASNIQYYPKWTDKYHLRWAYRIYDEPKLFKRYFWEYPKSLMVFIYDYINYRVNNKHTNMTD